MGQSENPNASGDAFDDWSIEFDEATEPNEPKIASRPSLGPSSTGDLRLGSRHDPLLVELVSDGRLRATLEETRFILRDRLQRAEVVRTGPGWALMRSLSRTVTPSTRQDAEQRREVVIAGALGESGIALIDVIGFLAGALQTGILSVYTHDTERSIYLSRGDVVWASSTAPEDQIGEFLVRRGKMTTSQLAVVQRESSQRIGRASVERGFIAAHDLWAMVQAQLTELFDRMLGSEAGLWTFSRIAEESLSVSQMQLSTQGLLMDSLRKLDEMRLYRETVRSSEAILRRRDPAVPVTPNDPRIQKLEPGIQELAVEALRQLPATASIHDLMRLLGKGEYEVTRLVYHLLRAKFVEVVPTDTVGAVRSGVSKTQSRDIVVIYSMAIREIFSELERSDHIQSLLETAAAFLHGSSGPQAELLRNIRISPGGALDEAALQAGLAQSAWNGVELSEALDELLFFLLFEATELLGPRRRDDLARRVKMIHGMLAGPEGTSRKA